MPRPAASATRRPGEVRLAYGMAPDGRVLHVSEVASGLGCGCACPGCGARLAAHKGNVLAHHFTHHVATDCPGGRESALHRLAKQVIDEHGMVTLPSVVARHGDIEKRLAEEMLFRPDEVSMEVALDGLRPDLIARKGDRDLLIEIAVTHFCGADKIALIQSRRIAAIEIDLSKVSHDADHETMVDAILYTAPRVWLFNGRADAAAKVLADAAARKAEEERLLEELRLQRQAEQRTQQARRLIEARVRPRGGATASPQGARDLGQISDAGLADLLTPDRDGPSCFAVAVRVWQAAIVAHFCLAERSWSEYGFRGADVWKFLCDAEMVHSAFTKFIDDETVSAAKALVPGFEAPYETMVGFLGRLEAHGCLRQIRRRWHHDGRTLREARERLATLTRARQRVEDVRADLDRLLGEMPPGHGVDAGRWMRTWQPALGMTPEARAMSSEQEAGSLREHLRRLSSLLAPAVEAKGDPLDLELEEVLFGLRSGEVEEELLGLPLIAQRETRRHEREAAKGALRRRREERARQREEEALEAARARQVNVKKAAVSMLGYEDGQRWLNAPQSVLGGLAVMSVDSFTEGQQEAALLALRDEQTRAIAASKAEIQARKFCERLLQDAKRAFAKKPAQADLWMQQPNRALGGRKPDDACIDQASYEACRSKLPGLVRPSRR